MEAEKLIDHPRTKDPLKSEVLPLCIKMYTKAASKIEKANSTDDIGEAWRYVDEASRAWRACCPEKADDCPQYDRHESLETYRSIVDQIIHAFWPQVSLGSKAAAPSTSKGSVGGLKAAAWDHNIKIRRA
ncbi:uncharacterized protein A4U43_C02F21910 [Asparagus officinalis]|uniref:Uncharacterized protein n=1 Tax=Asparagus officinalis TaxID=4686 RepID=A0A5P1FKE1_ASPOF|nr:uncharacterized protein A4U43_C02F21910 [Asparagus officinalis]